MTPANPLAATPRDVPRWRSFRLPQPRNSRTAPAPRPEAQTVGNLTEVRSNEFGPSSPAVSAIAFQLGPGLGLTAPPPTMLVPFISQIAAWPLVLWKRMSASPASVPMACQLGPGLALTGPAADDVGPVHLPDRDLAAGVLQQDVGMAVAIEIAGSDRFPARPGIGADGPAADRCWSRSSPRSRPARCAFCHRMSEWPSSLKSPVPTAFQLGPGLGPTVPPPTMLVPFISQIAAWPLWRSATGCRNGRRR